MPQKYIDDGYLVVADIFDPATVENVQAESLSFWMAPTLLRIL